MEAADTKEDEQPVESGPRNGGHGPRRGGSVSYLEALGRVSGRLIWNTWCEPWLLKEKTRSAA
ncbi:MAG: hypothetical protein CMJ85_02110 [Planctomycetes bacterium]|jgi:hypothetical protein|nr:hypothetical protein [Planctomycetota bacterium]